MPTNIAYKYLPISILTDIAYTPLSWEVIIKQIDLKAATEVTIVEMIAGMTEEVEAEEDQGLKCIMPFVTNVVSLARFHLDQVVTNQSTVAIVLRKRVVIQDLSLMMDEEPTLEIEQTMLDKNWPVK